MGTDFGSEKGKLMLVVPSIYSLKSSSAASGEMLAQTLRDIGYVSSKADPDVWLQAETKPDDTEYYAYVHVYVDDVLYLHDEPDTFMNRLPEVYSIKDGSVGETDRYLGANIEKLQLDDGSVAW